MISTERRHRIPRRKGATAPGGLHTVPDGATRSEAPGRRGRAREINPTPDTRYIHRDDRSRAPGRNGTDTSSYS